MFYSDRFVNWDGIVPTEPEALFQEMEKNMRGTWLTHIRDFEKLDEGFPGKVYLIYGNQRLAYFTSMKNRDNIVYNFSNMKLPIIR